MRRIRSHLTYANVMATIAVFLVLSGGTAVALSGSNTVFSDDIVDNQVYSADVRNDALGGGGLGAVDLKPGSVGSSEVVDSSLTGADVRDLSFQSLTLKMAGLGTVRAAVLRRLPRASRASCTSAGRCAVTRARLLTRSPSRRASIRARWSGSPSACVSGEQDDSRSTRPARSPLTVTRTIPTPPPASRRLRGRTTRCLTEESREILRGRWRTPGGG
jgi:hypothetical protein